MLRFKSFILYFLLSTIFMTFSQVEKQINVEKESFPQQETKFIEEKEKTKEKDSHKIEKIEHPEFIEEVPEVSRIEKLFNKRYKKESLKQFGYDIFKETFALPSASVGDNYVLGPGDEIAVYFWGDPVDVLGLQSYYTFEIDREGKVFIPSVGVIYVWGKTVKELKEELNRKLSKKFKRFNVDVSVGKLRNFPVYISGYVNKPGIVMAKGTYTVLEVLVAAGGISKNGSLRKIVLRRATGEEIDIDLYKLLIEGKPINIRVKDGDTIYVSQIGRTVGVAGAVKRPAIYELREESNVEEVIALAGGPLFSAYDYGVRILRYEGNKLKVFSGMLKDEKFKTSKIKDGDLIYIEDIGDFVWNRVTVEGHVQYPGEYSTEEYKTLRQLLKVIGILPDTNMYYGEIVRIEGPGRDPEVIRFVPLKVVDGKEDINLKPLDRILLYPKWIYAPIKVSGEIKNPKVIPYYEGITLLDVLRDIDFKDDIRHLKALIIISNFESEKDNLPRKEEEEKDRKEMINNKADREEIAGEIEEEIIDTDTDKDKKKTVYIYDLLVKGENNIALEPGTEILILKTEPTEKDMTVTILGEVKKPGVYKLEKDMTLYDLIVKAGGYTDRAYPRGLIFIRESAKKLQEEHLKIAITALEEAVARSEEGIGLTGATGEEKIALQLTLRKQRELLKLIKQKAKMGLGRVALDIPPTLEELKNSPENIILEDGDYIYVPSKPNYILVLGDVYNQISVPYIKGKPLSYYLEQVGGPGKDADLENIYIIKANGRVIARRNYEKFFKLSWEERKLYFIGDFMDIPLEEGDTIVVPTEIKVPTMWRPLIRDVVQIIFQAISTAVLAKRL